MKQLGITDTAFINLEHPDTPQHIAALGIYDPSTSPSGKVDFPAMIKHFERRIKQFPLFRTRLIQSPGSYSRPYWHVDDDFDVEFHVRHLAIPAPGDWEQLCKLVARMHSRPIDLSHPLWESYIIEGINIPGMPENCFAIYNKVHHSLVDGGGAANFMQAIHELTPEGHLQSRGDKDDQYDGEHEPTYKELLKTSIKSYMDNAWSTTKGTFGVTEQVVKTGVKLLKGDLPAPPTESPTIRFNQPVGSHRCVDACTFSLDDFKLIKNKTGTSINDVGLAIIAGGMRRYLEAHGEFPETSLVATVPMDMRLRRGEVGPDNNQVGSMFTSLHTNIDNPVQRLIAISHSASKAVELGEKTPLASMLKLAGALSPRNTKRIVKFYTDNKITQYLPFKINTVVSNVPGPQIPLYSFGAKLQHYYCLGLLTPGVGLFQMMFSYCGEITLTILGDRKSLPDSAFYRSCLEASCKELMYEITHSRDVDLIKMVKGAGHVGIFAEQSPPEKTVDQAPPKTRKRATRKIQEKDETVPDEVPLTAKKSSEKSTTHQQQH
ncbi:Putative diacyglycerol O-acyltransferase [BD1-7 clade bacterium]|uniref:diacylglycerol O-acyltransferase n=1 Tax=BD1-7 clade bacterium TaxID=2029982 RepID=A0A5S9NS87_9GAMM|nr:Putative diacyglycerol O-acyltransferase [BD1-7 clade bacterium]CAA0093473.1 Putative diacyglycerol O-acyltransferase [BD1-7 clade bacterium]